MGDDGTGPDRDGGRGGGRADDRAGGLGRPSRDGATPGADGWGRAGRSAGPPGRRSRGQLTRSTLWDDGDIPPGPQPLRARWDPVPPPRERRERRHTRSQRRRSRVGWFVHHYGWRAYALPVLAALTVVAVVGLIGSSGSDAGTTDDDAGPAGGLATVTAQQPAATTVTVSGSAVTTTVDQAPAGHKGPQTSSGEKSGAARKDGGHSGAAVESADGAPTTGLTQRQDTAGPSVSGLAGAHTAASTPPVPDVAKSKAFKGVVMGVLPPGGDFARTGAGSFHVVPGTSKGLGHGAKHRTFTIEVEDGIESAAADHAFADAVMHILDSDRSWIGGGKFTLKRVDSGHPDFRISLTSDRTTRTSKFCGWNVHLEASCYNRIPRRVVINDARWVRGAYSYDGDLASYRVYAINHEVGHALGHHHQPCPATGHLAPVMMQQSWSTSDDDLARLNDGGPVKADGKVCRANPFPYPHGG